MHELSGCHLDEHALQSTLQAELASTALHCLACKRTSISRSAGRSTGRLGRLLHLRLPRLHAARRPQRRLQPLRPQPELLAPGVLRLTAEPCMPAI